MKQITLVCGMCGHEETGTMIKLPVYCPVCTEDSNGTMKCRMALKEEE